jgi:hypothetical protein
LLPCLVGIWEAIEKYYADLFQKVHFSNNLTTYNDPNSPHIIGTAGNEMWENGECSMTYQVKGGDPVQIKGYHSSIAVREGGVWKKRMLTNNITPAPTATGTATPSPTAPRAANSILTRATLYCPSVIGTP